MSRFSAETIFKGVDKTSAVVRKIEQNASSASQRIGASFKKLDAQFSGMTSGMNKAGLAVGAGALAAGAGLFYVGKAGADFEEAITAVGAVSLMTRDQIADLEAKALELGATTKFTATEAANAMELMGRAGFTNAEIISGIGGILAAAAAEGAEMAEVTSHVSNVLKGMGLEASEAGRVADVLTLASARTNSSISSLGESMKNLSPVAKQFGISLEDSVAMVAMLQDVGLDASEAGTATATMLTKLSKPADEVAAKMTELGIAFKDAKGNMLPPLEVFKNMQAAAGKLGGNMDQVAFFADLVGLRGQKAALNLKDLFTSDKGQALSKELANAAGSAEKMAALRMQNLKGDFTLLESAIDGVKVALFNTESGPLRDLVRGMTEWVSANQKLIVSGFQEFMGGLRENLPTIVKWLGRIGKVVATVYAMSFAIKAVSVALAIASAIAKASPLFLWVYAITAAIALLWAFWPEISAFFTGLWETIKSIVGKIGEFLLAAFELWLGVGVLIWGPIIQGAIDLWNAIVSWLSPLFPFFQGLWASVSSGFSVAWESIKAVASTVWDTLTGFFAPLAEWFGSLWATIAAGFQATFGAVLDKISWAVGAVRSLGQAALGTSDEGGAQTPGERTAKSISESRSSVNGTIEVKSNVPAKVTRQPTGGVGLKVAHTGAL